MKKLPELYKNLNTKLIDNNKKVYYMKEDRSVNTTSVEDELNSIFNRSHHLSTLSSSCQRKSKIIKGCEIMLENKSWHKFISNYSHFAHLPPEQAKYKLILDSTRLHERMYHTMVRDFKTFRFAATNNYASFLC